MIELDKTTLICPRNDLESVTIIEIARKLGMDIRESTQGWGAQLGKEPKETFEGLRDNVIIVEMPDPEAEEKLESKGHEVIWIDHHRYYPQGVELDRIRPRSSLEQFADLVGHPLDDRELLIALNDRGSFWLMAQSTNCTLDEMESIQEEDIVAQGSTAEDKDEAKRAYENRVTFNDPAPAVCTFSLAVTQLEKTVHIANLHQRPTKYELDQYREEGKPLPVRAILILTLDERNKKVREVNFYGPWQFQETLAKLFENCGLDKSMFDTWQGGTSGRAFFWGAKKLQKEHGHIWYCDDLANAILNELVTYDRPMFKYSTVFFYPIKITRKDDTPPSAGWPWRKIRFEVQDEHYQEYVYFHQYARRILFPRADDNGESAQDPVIYYEYDLLNQAGLMPSLDITYKIRQFGFGGITETSDTLSYPLAHVAVHYFAKEKIAILAMQVTESVRYEEVKELPYLRDCLPTEEDGRQSVETIERNVDFWKLCMEVRYFRIKRLTTRDTLLFNELARKVYMSYVEQLDEGSISKIPETVSIRFPGFDEGQGRFPTLEHRFGRCQCKLEEAGRSPHVNSIICGLFGSLLGHNEYTPILDDRMVVYTFLGFAGKMPLGRMAIEAHEALFSRILYVDQLGDGGYVYDEAFIKNASERCIYRRWQNLGNLYGFTRYSSAYTGFGGIFASVIFRHFNSMYYQLALVSIFYRSFLIDFSEQVADVTEKLPTVRGCKRELFLKLKGDFMLFSNVYWFQEVTNQDQGIEIFDYYRQSFRYKEMYDQIKEEIDRADEYLEAEDAYRLSQFSTKFAVGGFVLGIGAIVTGYFGMNFFDINTPWPSGLSRLIGYASVFMVSALLVYFYSGTLKRYWEKVKIRFKPRDATSKM